MKQERLNLYLVDMKYIRNLHRADDKVSSVSPQIGKQHRIYAGIIVLCNSRKYLIPLSHAVAKHTKMKPRADFDKICAMANLGIKEMYIRIYYAKNRCHFWLIGF